MTRKYWKGLGDLVVGAVLLGVSSLFVNKLIDYTKEIESQRIVEHENKTRYTVHQKGGSIRAENAFRVLYDEDRDGFIDEVFDKETCRQRKPNRLEQFSYHTLRKAQE